MNEVQTQKIKNMLLGRYFMLYLGGSVLFHLLLLYIFSTKGQELFIVVAPVAFALGIYGLITTAWKGSRFNVRNVLISFVLWTGIGIMVVLFGVRNWKAMVPVFVINILLFTFATLFRWPMSKTRI